MKNKFMLLSLLSLLTTYSFSARSESESENCPTEITDNSSEATMLKVSMTGVNDQLEKQENLLHFLKDSGVIVLSNIDLTKKAWYNDRPFTEGTDYNARFKMQRGSKFVTVDCTVAFEKNKVLEVKCEPI